MSSIARFLEAARADEAVFISDVREAFEREGTRGLACLVTLYDDRVRRFDLRFPAFEAPEEREFAASYLNATVYNMLSSLGAKRFDLYHDAADGELRSLALGLNEAFQVDLPKGERSGYGKCLNVNERTLNALCEGAGRFRFSVHPLGELPGTPARGGAPEVERIDFAHLPDAARGRTLMGMDVGGTDVKIAVSIDGELRFFKEYDWFPAAFTRAEQLISPLVLLTRLMRAAAAMAKCGRADEVPAAALDKSATDAEMEKAASEMERAVGGALPGFDAIGLCFPDVVIRNRIVGGETYKTRGMREQAEVDYESEFAEITGLCDRLRPFVVEGGAIMNTNDGPMAAFTTAVEVAAAGENLRDGFFAHTLGTELGTGWILPDGSIPEIPLEVYNFIIDLGSFRQRAYGVDDARSVRNFNTGLSGTLQKCTCQSGVFRLAAKYLPGREPEVYARVLSEGLFVQSGGGLHVPTEPRDLRKPCLEFFMREAENPDSVSAEIFRRVGEYLAITWKETQYILEPACASRALFGRLVKTDACFKLIDEGAKRIVKDIRQFAADDALANSPLMKQLAAHPHYTIAQFAQAVGAIYFGCTGLKK